MEQINYTPPRPISTREIVSWRVGEPREEYDFRRIEKHGDVILRVECTDGVFLLLLTRLDAKPVSALGLELAH